LREKNISDKQSFFWDRVLISKNYDHNNRSEKVIIVHKKLLYSNVESLHRKENGNGTKFSGFVHDNFSNEILPEDLWDQVVGE
jgi:hypothetical protein